MQCGVACYTTLLWWLPNTPLQKVTKIKTCPGITQSTPQAANEKDHGFLAIVWCSNKCSIVLLLPLYITHILTTTSFCLTRLSILSMEFKTVVHTKKATLWNLTTPNTFPREGVRWTLQVCVIGSNTKLPFPI